MAAYKSCEIISKRLEEFSSSSSESEDSDYDAIISSSASQYSSSCTTKSKSTPATVQRLPTRRPDPNVSNRNALLARENRRKKKEYLETLEKELDSMKHVNKKLHKTLKKHMKLVKKLEHEKQYYKDLVSNQTGIRDLVSVFRQKSISSSEEHCKTCVMNRSGGEHSINDNSFVIEMYRSKGDMFSSGEGFLFLVTKTKPSPKITTSSKSLQRKDMEKVKASLKPNQ